MIRYDIFNNSEHFFGLKERTGMTVYYIKNSIQNSLLSEKKGAGKSSLSILGKLWAAFLNIRT